MYRYDSGHGDAILHIVSTTGSDGNLHSELKFMTLSRDKILRIHAIDMWLVRQTQIQPSDFGPQSARANISIALETTATLFTSAMLNPSTKKPVDNSVLYSDETAYATSAMFYVRGGVRYWVLGDSKGGINLHHSNGTFFKRDDIGKGPVVALDRFGPFAVFGAGSVIGVYSLGVMQVQHVCDEVSDSQQSSPVTDVSIDTSTSNNIVTAAFSNGDLIIFDTRSLVGDKYVCKTVLRIHSKNAPLKLVATRGGAFAWSQTGKLTYYNLAQVITSGTIESAETQLSPGSSPLLIKSLKSPSGVFFTPIASSLHTLLFFDVLTPAKPPPSSFDYGNLKVILYALPQNRKCSRTHSGLSVVQKPKA